jgi:hypothetical protein
MLDPNPVTENFQLASSKPERRLPGDAFASDFRSMEVLGSVPVWVLSGLRLERTGSRLVAAGWEVGVYRMDLAKDDGKDFFE